jgi:hypothetical protein
MAHGRILLHVPVITNLPLSRLADLLRTFGWSHSMPLPSNFHPFGFNPSNIFITRSFLLIAL